MFTVILKNTRGRGLFGRTLVLYYCTLLLANDGWTNYILITDY